MKTLIPAMVALTLAGTASATPLYDYFGPLPEATFGGTGIPNDEVAVSSQFEDGDIIITVALSATQRYSNPALSNDGAGTYFAQAGSNYGGSGQSAYEGALWNFNYYIDIDGPGAQLTDYEITLFYDFDPTEDNGPTTLGQLNLSQTVADGIGGLDPNLTRLEDSQNLMFGFLAADALPYVDAPGGSFDPNALGEYNFGIQVSRAGWSVEQVRMDVQVVPIPAGIVLFPSALAVLALFRRLQRR
ncbi:MAG: hypothetical protein ACN2B6_11745 [Rickettsiales bacterium]